MAGAGAAGFELQQPLAGLGAVAVSPAPDATNFMPHSWQAPAAERTTRGCIGQVNSVGLAFIEVLWAFPGNPK